MKVYMHCLTDQDINKQFAYTKEIREWFFDDAKNDESIKVKGKKSQETADVIIKTATDCRLNAGFQRILSKEGDADIGDIVIFSRIKFREYELELIKKADPLYEAYKRIFIDLRHLPICINDSKMSPPISQSHNRIVFGAPGTGKSYRLNNDSKEYFKEETIERVTFHPNYSYAQFVGTYKPVQDTDDEKQISYQYVPGPFMRVYAAAKQKQNQNQNFLLIVEEINRANVAAVFGDIFQLLDREDGVSEYPVAASEDIKKYLKQNGIDEDKLSIPSNMYIWATMNSADQGVFPMDTAFKRRWEFEYIGIDENEEEVKEYWIPINDRQKVKWNDLRKAINKKLISMKINEDKLLGPFFLSRSVLENAMDDGEKFIRLFKSKVLMYLFEDAAKMKPAELFDVQERIFSGICNEFDEKGTKVFKFDAEIDVVDIEEAPADAGSPENLNE